jgi:hypothetical protein
MKQKTVLVYKIELVLNNYCIFIIIIIINFMDMDLFLKKERKKEATNSLLFYI